METIYCRKKSRLPFKSGHKIGIIVKEEINPYTNNPGYLLSDGSIVEQKICEIISLEEIKRLFGEIF